MSAPKSHTKLRACLKCKLVKTETQWVQEGCENCDELSIRDDIERVQDCTSAYFEGLIAMMSPNDSWVSKWNGLERRTPGCYAVDVEGELPEYADREEGDKA
jgi:transcription elongation factor SPT4